MSKQQHHPGRAVIFAVLFMLLLLAIATGPIGMVVLVMAGIPIAILIVFASVAHGGSKSR